MFECFNICLTDRQVNVLLKILPILFDCHLPFMVWQIAESTEVCDKSVSNSIFELLRNSVVIYMHQDFDEMCDLSVAGISWCRRETSVSSRTKNTRSTVSVGFL